MSGLSRLPAVLVEVLADHLAEFPASGEDHAYYEAMGSYAERWMPRRFER